MSEPVEILALIDRSGSMNSIMKSAVASFNEFINEQKSQDIEDEVFVTLSSFDSKYETVFRRVPLHDMPSLTVGQVKPRGMTALYDSIGKLINDANYPDRPTVVLIQTDGMDNSSREFSSSSIRELISEKESLGWEFNFIGAGLSKYDVDNMSSSMGISRSIAVSATAGGMEDFKSFASSASTDYRNRIIP